MATLIQLIGPQACGKTTLRKLLAPDALDISYCLNGYFNDEMLNSFNGFYFHEEPSLQGLRNLEDWLSGDTLRVERRGQCTMFTSMPPIWIYEGHRPIYGNFESLIWEIKRGR